MQCVAAAYANGAHSPALALAYGWHTNRATLCEIKLCAALSAHMECDDGICTCELVTGIGFRRDERKTKWKWQTGQQSWLISRTEIIYLADARWLDSSLFTISHFIEWNIWKVFFCWSPRLRRSTCAGEWVIDASHEFIIWIFYFSFIDDADDGDTMQC